MASPISTPGANLKLLGNGEDIGDIEVLRTNFSVISTWRLTPEELKQIAKTGVIYVELLCTKQVPPVAVMTDICEEAL